MRAQKSLFLLLLIFHAQFAGATPQVVFREDFGKAELNSVPEGFLVLDGGFAVKEVEGNRCLELPGTPLESFAAQFGPVPDADFGVSARIRGSARGRRFPVFGVGLNGVAGYQLRLSPAKDLVELCRDQKVKVSAAFIWKSNVWLRFKLQISQLKAGIFQVRGKIWIDGEREPNRWTIDFEDQEKPPAGRASIFGSPYSGNPIQFDDLEAFKP
jgi:hypothetical protein